VRDQARIDVRSFRTVFDLERRIYRIDGIRLNPSGVPVRGVVYAAVLAILVAALTTLPLVGLLLRELPWPARHLLLPTVLATLASLWRIDGRPCHVALRSLALLAVGPRRLSGWRRIPSLPHRWRPPRLLLIPDGSDARLRRARFRGPGAVVVAIGHELRERRARPLVLRAQPGTPHTRKVVALTDGARLDIDPGRGR
jgi:hypothetical protein